MNWESHVTPDGNRKPTSQRSAGEISAVFCDSSTDLVLTCYRKRNRLWTRTTAHSPSQPGPASEPFGTEVLVGDAEPALTNQDCRYRGRQRGANVD